MDRESIAIIGDPEQKQKEEFEYIGHQSVFGTFTTFFCFAWCCDHLFHTHI